MRRYEMFSRYYHYHWEEYSQDYPEFIEEAFTEFLPRETPRSLCDMGCGTGHVTRLLQERGFDCFGVDVSCEMIDEAVSRSPADGPRFYQGDMRTFTFPHSTHCIVLAYDAINYLHDKREVIACLRHLASQLAPGGLVIFDSNTPEIYWRYHGVREEFSVPDGSITQKTRYRPLKRQGVTVFTFDIGGERYIEEHVQRVYSPKEMTAMIRSGGLDLLACFDDFSFRPLHSRSQKPIFIARRALT